MLRTLLDAQPRLLDIGEIDDRLVDVPRAREALAAALRSRTSW